MVMVTLVGVMRVNALGDDSNEKKPAAAPSKKPIATPRSHRNRAVVAPPAAAPVEAPSVPALPTNSNGVAPAAALPQPETNPIEPAGDRGMAAMFEAYWWSHTRPSFCEEKPKRPPLLPPEGVDPHFRDRWNCFASSLRLLIKDGESVNRFFEL